MINKQWFKIRFTQANALQRLEEVALVLAADDTQAMTFVVKSVAFPVVQIDCQPYSTTSVMTADFATNQNGNPSNVDYIMVAE